MNIETPCIVIDKNILQISIDKLHSIGDVFFPIKANAFPPLILYLAELGCNFNVNSISYLNTLIDLGIASEGIIYDNCLSTAKEIDIAISSGIKNFSIDSRELYEYILNKDSSCNFFIKIASTAFDYPSGKFGCINFNDFYYDIKNSERLLGISFYLGSKNANSKNLLKMVCQALSLGPIHCLNIGGGYENIWNYPKLINYLKRQKKSGKIQRILLEPGRSLINPAAKMYSRVLNVRQINAENWIRIDASIYSGLMDLYIEKKTYPIRISCEKSVSTTTRKYHVSGFTTDQCDYFGVYDLPSNLKPGDILQITNCGAYSFDMSCPYSGANYLLMRLK